MRYVRWTLGVAGVLLVTVFVVPVRAQADPCAPAALGDLNATLGQAIQALEEGDTDTAYVLLHHLRATMSRCFGTVEEDRPFGSPNPVVRNAEWEPYVQTINGVEMVLVPPGCFEMGTNSGAELERPAHRQCFADPFWIDRYEVSNAQRHHTDPAWANDTQPVAGIGWGIAREVCLLRNARLPTEAEWEYAARGPDGLVFPWGSDFVPENVVYRGNAGEADDVFSHPDGASWVGALNMSGNVMEWTSSLAREYPYAADDYHELLTSDGSPRILRGGSFYDDEFYLRAAYRVSANTSNSNNNVGVRCAVSYGDAP